MIKDTIFLADLTHVTSLGWGTETIPYAVACIKSWLCEHSAHKDRFNVRLFKHPQRFIDAVLAERPVIVGLSNYMWNLDLSYSIAEAIKRRRPETLIVFGGPNYPIDDGAREEWLRAHPAVDVHVSGEGEGPFAGLVDAWYRHGGDLDAVKREPIGGSHSIVDGAFMRHDDVGARMANLDLIPSPYLAGYLDEFLSDVTIVPLLESNRGCPFTCTFCVDGIGARTKVYWKSASRFEEELEYIAQRYSGKVLDLADVNFGMYKQDVEVTKAIVRVRERHNYPAYVHVATGKNQKARVLECVELLGGSLRVSASVQSLDPDVLKNIKRQNIAADELVQVAKSFNASDANTYSEVILGLPGDTKEKHMDSVLQLADADMKLISLFTLMMLDGTELTTKASMARWACQTKFRIVPRCFGVYQFGDEALLSAEPEEVAVGSNTMSFDDYLECRRFALTMGLFYQDRILYELYGFLKVNGIPPSVFLRTMHERAHTFSDGIGALYASFIAATRDELWDSRAELVAFVKSDASVVQKYVSGELGNNVVFRHRALALLNLVDEIHDAAFAVAAELLEARDPKAAAANADYLGELRQYSTMRKRDLFGEPIRYAAQFRYDFQRLVDRDFAEWPVTVDTPQDVVFEHTREQQEMLTSQYLQYGKELNAIGRIISRMATSKLQRSVTFGGVAADRVDYQYVPGQKRSPSEFV